MIIELKACPFCGKTMQRRDCDGLEEYTVWCSNCGAIGPNELSEKRADEMWNMRREETTLHDQLTVVLAKLASYEEKGVLIKFMNEDELPEGICDSVYSAMFNCSHVEAVRLFPYVEDSEEKYFLILPEVAKKGAQ